MDSQFEGPLGFKFGIDAIIGLIPFVGDFATTGFSLYLVFQAARFNCSSSTLLRMGLNVMIDNLIDMVPFIGNLFDFWWKSNDKNMALLEAHLQNPQKLRGQSKMILTLICFILVGFISLSAYLSYWVIASLYQYLQSA